HGYLPYVHVWENKPPGIYAIDAAVFYVWPKSFRALAATEGIFILGAIGTLFLILRYNFRAPLQVALVCAAAASTAVNLQALNESGNLTEIYLLWPALLSVFFFTRSNGHEPGWNLLAAGFFSGAAALIKPVGFAALLAEGTAIVLLVFFRRLSLGR